MKCNGFYLSAPSPYVDYVAGNNKFTGVIHWAYFFLENGIVRRKSKDTKDKVVEFRREDFDNAYAGEYTESNGYIYMIFDKNQQWELRTKFKICDHEIIAIESNSTAGVGQKYEFHEW